MNFSRNTYLEVDLGKIKNNVKTIINNYPAYKYYFGLVKANCYGLDNESLAVTKAIIDAGCNYLAVATLEEAIVIRKEFKSIPILVLGHINKEHIKEAIEYNITITMNVILSVACVFAIVIISTFIQNLYIKKISVEKILRS